MALRIVDGQAALGEADEIVTAARIKFEASQDIGSGHTANTSLSRTRFASAVVLVPVDEAA